METAMTSDLITTVAMIAHDPLVGGSALIAFGALVGRMLFKQKPMWRAVARVIFLILLTLLLLYDGIVPYQPLQLTGRALPRHDRRNVENRLVALGGLVLGRLGASRGHLRRAPAGR